MKGRGEEANMPKFMFIFRGGAQEYPDLSPTEMQEHLKKWYAWAGELAKAGRLLADSRSTTAARR
jgi:hypothetical protein